MNPALVHHLQMASLFGLLAKKYEYIDPEAHYNFYRRHFYHTQMVDKLYRQSAHTIRDDIEFEQQPGY